MVKTTSKISPEVIAFAKKWGKVRGIPPELILATIWAESKGNVKAYAKNEREESFGLMQINWKAHGPDIIKAGRKKEELFNPDFNIEWGSKVLKRAYDRAVAAKVSDPVLGARYAYTGRVPTSTYLPTAANWKIAIASTKALV